ncbi:DUF6082 family protein [Luteolibacter pohnpeiensis]|uniref:DUF6082 family protein n=1 Tax=Luteolibacter pohnpeiensis TaxID=454153 RepID=UPI003CCD8873
MISVLIALVSLAIQQHLARQQIRYDTRVKHYDRTQSLLFKALDDSDLLEALTGGSPENQKQRRYRQLWFNHIKLIFDQRKLFRKGRLGGHRRGHQQLFQHACDANSLAHIPTILLA